MSDFRKPDARRCLIHREPMSADFKRLGQWPLPELEYTCGRCKRTWDNDEEELLDEIEREINAHAGAWYPERMPQRSIAGVVLRYLRERQHG